ncbi:hypothetical protein SY85_11955 [Flavisolibacter tropicus]|uniref:Uncharacterized protein n=1 Tax=Flavisolibacter tropicus TaxID=1492898 RepID=A0A172TVK3_9BACT|nr:hypothetical protein SY85_11955 [Flavisolibacter tropicus]
MIAAACNTAPKATGRNGIQFKTPTEYNDYIITRQQEVARLIDQFTAASAFDEDSAQAVLQKSSRITGEYLTDLSAMSDYKGDTAFRNAAVNNFTFYKRIFDNEYKTLLVINSKGNKVSAADAQRAIAITQSLTAEEAELDKHFTNAQHNFAQKNKLSLESAIPAKPNASKD